jgi:hypothetical protein
VRVRGDANNLVFITNTAERMRLDSSGNVGIGTSSPSYELDIQSSSGDAEVAITGSTTNNAVLKFENVTSNTLADIYADNSKNLIFRTNSTTERMRIDSSGNVGIGGGTISSKLFINTDTVGDSYFRGGADNSRQLDFSTFATASPNAGHKINATSVNGQIAFATGGTERMRIDSSGNVGIGTSSPSEKLQVEGTVSATGMKIGANGTDINSTFLGASSLIAFKCNGTERMRIDSSGNLLVGTTSNPYSGRIVGYGAPFVSQATGTSASDRFYFVNGNGIVGYIRTSGSSTSYNTSSDQRLKENIADADDAGSKIDSIQVRQYDWKADGSHQDYGMIAQELQTVAPEAVSGDADSEEMMGVDYSKLVPMLIKEIQSLRNRVAQLEE